MFSFFVGMSGDTREYVRVHKADLINVTKTCQTVARIIYALMYLKLNT